jgi:hypothetical protein
MDKMKEAHQHQTRNLPLAPTSHANPWLEAAAECGSGTGPLLKFNKGEWKVGDDIIADGVEYIAHLDQVIRGWVKFGDGKVVERVIGKIADGFRPPKREELSDTDPERWRERDNDNRPRDPWVQQWFLPLVSVQTGELVTFATSSKGGINAVGDLCGIYGRQFRDGLLPIIALKTRSYRHPDFGKILTPDFAILGWDDGGLPAETTTQPTLPAKNATVTVDADADIRMDEIPFTV